MDSRYGYLLNVYASAYVTYDGEWKKGTPNGEGNTFEIFGVFENATVPEGYWGSIVIPRVTISEMSSGLFHGDAEIYSDGHLYYEGEMKSGKYSGDGKRYYDNGQLQYDGHWKSGEYNGKGKLYDEDGKLIYSGKWKNGDYAS